MKRTERRSKSAKLRRVGDNRSQLLNIVNLKIDEAPVVNASLPRKLELLIKQHEYEQRTNGGRTEDSANDVHPLFGTTAADQVIINASKSAPNVRPRPYRPISSHQYLTLTELKETAVQDGDRHLGRPTRTTLLRERQRRRSMSNCCEVSQKNGQKQELRVPTRYEAVTNILYAMIPAGQSLHSFISGARYNRAHWIESLGSLSFDSDLPNLSSLTLGAPKCRPVSVPHDVSCVPRAPPDSPADVEDSVCKDESSTAIFPLLSTNEQTTLKPGTDNRSLKVAWEDAKLMATVSDKTTAEKVRFQSEETTCEAGAVPGIHRDKGQSTVRPSSVRLFALPLAKPAADIESVMIHGTSIIGSSVQAAPRDLSSCHPSQADRPKELRSTWSARSCPDPLDPEALTRLGPLKVTGVRVSGEGGKAGGKVSSTFRLNRVKNDSACSEAAAECSDGCQVDGNCGVQVKVDPDGGSDHLEAVEQRMPGRPNDLENLGHGSEEEEATVSVPGVQLSSPGAGGEEFLCDGDKASGKDIQMPETEQLTHLEENSFEEETADVSSFENDSKIKGHSEDTRVEVEHPSEEEEEDNVLFFITEEEEDSGDVGKDSGGYHGNGKEAEEQDSDNNGDLDSTKDSAT